MNSRFEEGGRRKRKDKKELNRVDGEYTCRPKGGGLQNELPGL